jgi:pimeloyl-ACP methyl ester carboxylesterase
MRLFEILIPVTLGIYLLWPFLTGRANAYPFNFLPFLASGLVGAHLLFEGYRWHMIPLYLLTGILLLASLPSLFHPGMVEFNRLSWRAAGVLVSLFLLAACTALPVLLPVPSIPSPGGAYLVGTRTFVLSDSSRRELYSGQEEPRRFMIQVWYPADPGPNDQHAPWMPKATVFGRSISKYLGLPEFFLDHLALSESPAWQDAPPYASSEGYPIILFSHGWSGFAAQNTGQALELASRGYVVVALQHTFGAVVTVFPDGEVVYNNPSALPDGMPEPGYTDAARKLVKQWSGDMALALDTMAEQNGDPADPFFSSLDLTSVGVYGHSTGGGAAIQFCGTDPRCKAVLAMDPFMTPVSAEVQESGLSQPAFFMFSQRWADDVDSKNNRLFKPFYSNLEQATGVIAIEGTTHYDFSDLPMLSPITPQLGLKGPLNGERVTQIVDDYLISFFDSTLKDQPTDLLDGPSRYPEIIDLH